MEDTPELKYSFGPYVLDRSEWRLRKGNEAVDLPPKAFAVLLLLVERAGTLVLKEEILSAIWKETFVEEGNISFYINTLRKALNDPPDTAYIETVKTRGYRFAAPVVVSGHRLEAAPALPDVTAAPVEVSPRKPTRWKWWPGAAVLAAGVLALLAWWAFFTSENIASVVVVPFQAIGPAEDQAYLQNGIAEAVAMRLSSMTTLRVPPLAAIRQKEDPFEAARRLGTDAVLTGSVQRAGGRLLVAAQLSNVREQKLIWSSSFDTTPGEILQVQNEIAERIAVRLGTGLKTEKDKPTQLDTLSGAAYDAFLQAREQWRWRTPASIKVAIGLYEKALQIDPEFARAYAGLANCYNVSMSGLPADYRYPRAKANAEKAVALDPASVEGHTALAFLRYKFEWRWKDADDEFKRAIAIDPRFALAHHWYGEFLGLMNRQEEAVRELKLALELDPYTLAVRNDLSMPLVRLRRLDEARAVLDAGLKIEPNWYGFQHRMAEIFEIEGKERESAESTWRSMVLRGMPFEEVEELRKAFAKGGLKEMTRAQIDARRRQEVNPTSPTSILAATFLSFDYGKLGEKEEAFHWLNVAVERREDAVIHLLTNPAYDSLRGDPRFNKILERVGLANPPASVR